MAWVYYFKSTEFVFINFFWGLTGEQLFPNKTLSEYILQENTNSVFYFYI